MSKFLTNILNQTPGSGLDESASSVVPRKSKSTRGKARGTTPTSTTTSDVDTLPSQTTQSSPGTLSSSTTPTSPSSATTPSSETSPATTSSSTTPSSETRPTRSEQDERRYNVAPLSDFHKVANANVRDGIPDGAFPGKSKKIYDVLYQLSRGAMPPKRTVRISKPKLMKMASIGSKVTVDNALNNFVEWGLVNIEERPGEHEGNIYEVFIYGENGSPTSATSRASRSSSSQKLDGVDRLESSQTSLGLDPVNYEASTDPKTLFKDFLNPDDVNRVLNVYKRIEKAIKLSTGKGITKAEWEGIDDLVTLIIGEIDRAAKYTSNVSVFSKFGAEILRRKFANKKSKAPKKYFDPGRSEEIEQDRDYEAEMKEFEPKPLSKAEKSSALDSARTMLDNGSDLLWLEPLYTPDDWKWIMKNLGIEVKVD